MGTIPPPMIRIPKELHVRCDGCGGDRIRGMPCAYCGRAAEKRAPSAPIPSDGTPVMR